MSEVQKSVFNEMRLDNLTRLDPESAERERLMWQASGSKMVLKQTAKVKEEEDRFTSGRKDPKRGVVKVENP